MVLLTGLLTAHLTLFAEHRLAPADSNIVLKHYFASYTKKMNLIDTKLDLSFNWDSAFVYGKATLQLKPYFYATDSLVLNANSFKINKVTLLNGKSTDLKYSYDGSLLKIALDKIYSKNQVFNVYIEYTAMPYKAKLKNESIVATHGVYFTNHDPSNKDLPKQIWSQGETEGNSFWFPTINGPQTKMTQQITLTVDKQYTTLSNGLMISSKENANGTRTDVWKQDKPSSTYLTMIAVGDFKVVKDKWRNKEVSYYVNPKLEPFVKENFGQTPQMIDFFSKILKTDYPWDKYSQVVAYGYLGGAMENTSATLHGVEVMALNHDKNSLLQAESVVAHELFHQWFGDLVTCESWPNIPLNESFATYGAYLWLAHNHGREAADYDLLKGLSNYYNNPHFTDLTPIRFSLNDPDEMFDPVSYPKGGAILHMLRNYVGDEAFFESLHRYLEQNKFKTAEIHNLRLAFEEVTGEDLNWFFNQWFLQPGHPVLNVDYKYDETAKKLKVSIKQNQDLSKYPLYRLPIVLDIYTSGKIEQRSIELTNQSQSFVVNFPQKPDLVNINPDHLFVAKISDNKTPEQWVELFKRSALMNDKLTAIKNLSELKDNAMAQQFMLAQLNEKDWMVRSFVISALNKNSVNLIHDNLYKRLTEMAKTDEVGINKIIALVRINQLFPEQNNKALFTELANDKDEQVKTVAANLLKSLN